MQSATVVETLDVFKDAASGLLAGLVRFEHVQFGFQGAEEALHHGIVPAVLLAAHAAAHTVLLQQGLVFVGNVLNASIGVHQQTGHGPSAIQCHEQGFTDQCRGVLIGHGPANDASGIQLHHDGQVQRPLAGGNEGDVAGPGQIRRFRQKLPVQVIAGHSKALTRLCRDHDERLITPLGPAAAGGCKQAQRSTAVTPIPQSPVAATTPVLPSVPVKPGSVPCVCCESRWTALKASLQ